MCNVIYECNVGESRVNFALTLLLGARHPGRTAGGAERGGATCLRRQRPRCAKMHLQSGVSGRCKCVSSGRLCSSRCHKSRACKCNNKWKHAVVFDQSNGWHASFLGPPCSVIYIWPYFRHLWITNFTCRTLSMSWKHWKNRHVNSVKHLSDPPLSSKNPAPNPARPTLTRA